MVCFCKTTMTRLQLALPQLNVAAELDVDVTLDLQVQLIARWLAQFGLPAAPWQPDEAWLDIQLPTISLGASAMATISAFAQLRADVLAQFGIDLLIPGQATGLARMAVTLQARLQATLDAQIDLGLGLGVNAAAWIRLAATLHATAQVQAALDLGLFPAPPPGPPLATWRPFLIQLRALLPLIAVSIQLGIDLSADISAQLSAMLRVMLRIQLPAFPQPTIELMASLTAGLTAVAQLRAGLGIEVDLLALGIAEVQLMVAARVRATAAAVRSSIGMELSVLLDLLGLLPKLEFSATLMANPATVAAAMRINAQALARVDWQVPPVADLPILNIGLPVVAFAAQLKAALNVVAGAAAPCLVCDAMALMRPSAPAATMVAEAGIGVRT